LNILVIPCWYPNKNSTDKLMGIYHKEFCEALAKNKDINVNMLYIDRQRLNAPIKYLFMKKKEIINEDGYNVYMTKELDIHKISDKWQLKRYCKKMETAFLEYLKDNPKPDVIHAQVTIPSGYAATKIGEKYNIPVLITEHAHAKRFFVGVNKEYGDYVRSHAHITTVSKFMAKELKEIGINASVLSNLVDLDTFKKKRTKINSLRLVVVSALREGKRIDDVIESLKVIKEKDKNIDARLTVVGDGFLEDYYKNRCHELEMDQYVDFVGRKTKKEISDILMENNILVIGSEFETFAISGIEALASGMPVVSTKCNGPEEYIDSKCGKLVPVGDINKLSEAILDVYKNLDNYDISYMQSVADKYSSKAVTKKAIEIYKGLLQGKNNWIWDRAMI